MKNHHQIIFMDTFSFSSISLMNSFSDSTVSENHSIYWLKRLMMSVYKCDNNNTVTGEVNRQRLVELTERQRRWVQWESDASAAEASWQDAADETTAQDHSHRQRCQRRCGHARRYAHLQPRQERLLFQLVRSVHPLSHSHWHSIVK